MGEERERGISYKGSMSSFFPFWTNATVAHESQQYHQPCCSPQASIHVNDIFCYDSAAKIHDEKRNDTWETIILSSYLIDFEWLCQTVPSLATVQKHLIVLSGEKGTATVRVVEASAGGSDGSCKKVSHYSSVPAFQNNNNPMLLAAVAGGIPREKIVILEPPLPYPYGTHHSKFVLAINSYGIRVVICTANFIHDDWVNKTQGAYIQDFPRTNDVPNHKEAGDRGLKAPPSSLDDYQLQKGEDFRSYLQLYLERVGLLSHPRIRESGQVLSFSPQDLGRFDFSSAKVWLFGAVPGAHRGERLLSFGMHRLSALLSKAARRRALSSTDPPTPLKKGQPVTLSWQYSSQGALNDAFLSTLQGCMTAPDTVVDRLRVVYPTEEEVRRSLEGWRGGLSLPLNLRSCHPFINQRLHRWGNWEEQEGGEKKEAEKEKEREGPLVSAAALWSFALPHIKSYAAVEHAQGRVVWFALTSANLSQAAWGSGSLAKGLLFIRSYELGVLYDATSQVEEEEEEEGKKKGKGWFDVTPHRSLPRPTAAAAGTYLFATPVAHASVGLYLPYSLLEPRPYASTAELLQRGEQERRERQEEQKKGGKRKKEDKQEEREGGTVGRHGFVSSRDVPWVVDLPHRGRDSLGRCVEEAVQGYSQYGPTGWVAPVRSEFAWAGHRAGSKRARSRE